jgi:chromosomal replication initiator protein
METWLDPIELVNVEQTSVGQRLILGCPSKIHQYWIVENLLDRICAEVSALYQKPFEVELIVNGIGRAQQLEATASLENAMIQRSPSMSSQTHVSKAPNSYSDPNPMQRDTLNLDYTFATFVVGRNNEFAHAASFNVAQNPGADGYNPLFICGPVGMGKTHLLNAVGNNIRSDNPHLRISYVSAERFLNECVSAIRRGEMEKFRMRYRERCDVLLVDDVQVLGRGEAVQEEFFHTLNDFFDRKRQVVVASDRMPKDILGLEDRIRSRLEWGLIADIQMPDIETRVAILRYKAERLSMKLSDDVVNHIARLSKRSIRELEGNLKKVKMFSELQGLVIDINLVKKILASHENQTAISVEDIQKLVADHYKVKVIDLKSNSRAKSIVIPRQAAMFLIKKYLDKSLVDIGKIFGNKDHTTVINAMQRIQSLQTKDPEIKKDIEELTARIHNITGV